MSRPLHRTDPETLVIRRPGHARAQERRGRAVPDRAPIRAILAEIAVQHGPEAAFSLAQAEVIHWSGVVFERVTSAARARAQALFAGEGAE